MMSAQRKENHLGCVSWLIFCGRFDRHGTKNHQIIAWKICVELCTTTSSKSQGWFFASNTILSRSKQSTFVGDGSQSPPYFRWYVRVSHYLQGFSTIQKVVVSRISEPSTVVCYIPSSIICIFGVGRSWVWDRHTDTRRSRKARIKRHKLRSEFIRVH